MTKFVNGKIFPGRFENCLAVCQKTPCFQEMKTGGSLTKRSILSISTWKDLHILGNFFSAFYEYKEPSKTDVVFLTRWMYF